MESVSVSEDTDQNTFPSESPERFGTLHFKNLQAENGPRTETKRGRIKKLAFTVTCRRRRFHSEQTFLDQELACRLTAMSVRSMMT
jgi:hypothetical protein